MIKGTRTHNTPMRGRRQRAARRLAVLLTVAGSTVAVGAPAAGAQAVLQPPTLPTQQSASQLYGDPLSPISSDPTKTPTQPGATPFDDPPPASADPAVIGSFAAPFTEPTIRMAGGGQVTTNAPCVRNPNTPNDPTYDGLIYDCKPAGVAVNILPATKPGDATNIMYFDGLEGTENVKYSIVAEYGNNSINDQSRLLKLPNGDGQGASWTAPQPVDGGANPKGYGKAEYLLPAPLVHAPTYNAGALFCTDQIFLPDGTVLASGGTAYYNEPGLNIGKGNFGVTELEGLKNSRIYLPSKNRWVQSGDMQYGRWYPTDVTLPSGHILTVSGVTKLIKPVYPTHPQDSGTNVKQTETYDPVTGRWTTNPATGSKSLPLFARIHELPDGKVFYNAAGQSFNPFGQSYDEASWNIASVYNPQTQAWQDLGVPGLTDLAPGSKPVDMPGLVNSSLNSAKQGGIPGAGNAATLPGFRGSTFSVEMPLVPDASGHYNSASFLTAGGVLNPPSPGSYLATNDSRMTTVDTSGGQDKMSTKPTGDLPGPRWYPSGVLLPTGQVLAFNGADRDEVIGPGTEVGKRQAELFDPATQKWTPLASAHDVRTYHNSAALLPDGRVLVSGHATISTLYGRNITLPGGVTAPNDGRDPSFEVFSPPYMHWGPQPVITNAATLNKQYGQAKASMGYGRTFQVKTDQNASAIKSVVMVSNTSVNHLVDANQRNVELPVVARNGNTLTVKAPPSADVAPPGPYMLFVNKQTDKGLVPSKSAQMFLGLARLEQRATAMGHGMKKHHGAKRHHGAKKHRASRSAISREERIEDRGRHHAPRRARQG